MIKRARIGDARVLADLAIQMWTDHDPENLEEEFRKLAISDEAALSNMLMINRLLLRSVGCGTIM